MLGAWPTSRDAGVPPCTHGQCYGWPLPSCSALCALNLSHVRISHPRAGTSARLRRAPRPSCDVLSIHPPCGAAHQASAPFSAVPDRTCRSAPTAPQHQRSTSSSTAQHRGTGAPDPWHQRHSATAPQRHSAITPRHRSTKEPQHHGATTRQHHSATATHRHSTAAPQDQHHSTTTSRHQHHNTGMTPQHHSTTVPQHHGRRRGQTTL